MTFYAKPRKLLMRYKGQNLITWKQQISLRAFLQNCKLTDVIKRPPIISSARVAVRNGLKCCNSRQSCQKSTPSRMDDFAVLTALGKRDTVTDSSDMKRAILYPTVYFFWRTQQATRDLMGKTSKSSSRCRQLIQRLIISLILMELRQAKQMNVQGLSSPQWRNTWSLYMAFTELYKVIKIAVTLPVSTAGCERIFSKLKLIKTHLRTTMADERLKSLTVISVHRHRLVSTSTMSSIELPVNTPALE